MRVTSAAFLLICLLFSPIVHAEAPAPLADRIPADAMVYIGWAGSEPLSGKYQSSHLKPIIDASEIPQLFTTFVPELIHRVARDNSQASEILQQVADIGAPMWKHPIAFYFGGIDWNGPTPLPRMAFLCDAGDDAAHLTEQIGKLLEQLPQTGGPMPSVKQYGSLVVLAFGTTASIDAEFSQPPANSLASSSVMTTAIAQVQKNAAFVGFVDGDSLVKMVDDTLGRINNEQVTERWQKIRDSLNVTGLHFGIATADFDGPNWITQSYVSTSDNHDGVVSLFHNTPLSKEILQSVPQTADRVLAGKFNLDGLVGTIHDLLAQFNPPSADQMDDALGNINQAVGLDIRRDLLAQLGDEWCLYSDDSVAGPGILGTVLINRSKDATAVDHAMNQVAQKANDLIAQLMHQPQIKIEFCTAQINAVDVHYLAIPFITPSWTVSDGNVYFGFYPQVVAAAAEQGHRKGKSILDRPEFTDLMKRLGNQPAGMVEFCDLPKTARQGYTDLLAMSRLYLGIADVFGVHPPADVVPLLSKITPELAPSGSISWSDDTGFHTRSISPFPGSDLLSGSGLSSSSFIAQQSLLASILLPSLNKARGNANRVKCASNERQIGLAILLYANDHNQKLPDDLGTLVKEEQIGAGVFICPEGQATLPPNIATMTPDDQVNWVNDHTDYVYLGKGQTENQMQATRIILYEKEGAHHNEGMNLLFGDGHVEWQTRPKAEKLIHDQEGGL